MLFLKDQKVFGFKFVELGGVRKNLYFILFGQMVFVTKR